MNIPRVPTFNPSMPTPNYPRWMPSWGRPPAAYEYYTDMAGLTKYLYAPKTALANLRKLEYYLGSPSYAVRAASVAVLSKLGTDGLPGLLLAIQTNQPTSVRVAAVMALQSLGTEAAPATQFLADCLHSPDGALRYHAGVTLGKIGGPAVPALREMLDSPNLAARAAAIGAVGNIGGEHAKELVYKVEEISRNGPPPAKVAALSALYRMGGDKQHLYQLGRMLESPDGATRALAAEQLRDLGPLASELQPLLYAKASDPSPEVRRMVHHAITRVAPGAHETVYATQMALRDPEAAIRWQAAVALPGLTSAARTAKDVINNSASAKDQHMRAFAASAQARADYALREATAPYRPW